MRIGLRHSAGLTFRRSGVLSLASASFEVVVGINSLSIGAVTIVVTNAIKTIIANSVGEITLRSRPMFKTINSIRRVCS